MPVWLIRLVMVSATALMAYEIFEAGREIGAASALFGDADRLASEALGG